jgi:hypothetical protein
VSWLGSEPAANVLAISAIQVWGLDSRVGPKPSSVVLCQTDIVYVRTPIACVN